MPAPTPSTVPSFVVYAGIETQVTTHRDVVQLFGSRDCSGQWHSPKDNQSFVVYEGHESCLSSHREVASTLGQRTAKEESVLKGGGQGSGGRPSFVVYEGKEGAARHLSHREVAMRFGTGAGGGWFCTSDSRQQMILREGDQSVMLGGEGSSVRTAIEDGSWEQLRSLWGKLEVFFEQTDHSKTLPVLEELTVAACADPLTTVLLASLEAGVPFRDYKAQPPDGEGEMGEVSGTGFAALLFFDLGRAWEHAIRQVLRSGSNVNIDWKRTQQMLKVWEWRIIKSQVVPSSGPPPFAKAIALSEHAASILFDPPSFPKQNQSRKLPENTPPTGDFCHLPEELVLVIMSFLEWEDLQNVALVCRNFYHMTSSEYLWMSLFDERKRCWNSVGNMTAMRTWRQRYVAHSSYNSQQHKLSVRAKTKGILLHHWEKLRPLRVAFVGHENSGKQTVLRRLMGGNSPATLLHRHREMRGIRGGERRRSVWFEVNRRVMSMSVLSGLLWPQLFKTADVLVYVMNACNDGTMMVLARQELHHLINVHNDCTRETAPLLVFLTEGVSSTHADPISAADVAEYLGLYALRRKWRVQSLRSKRCDGLKEGLDWLTTVT